MENNFFSKKPHYTALMVLILGLVFFAGYFIGGNGSNTEQVANVINRDDGQSEQVDFSAFWKAWNVIDQKYMPTTASTSEDVSTQARVYGAIEGMVAALGDPYTVFFPPVEAKVFNEEIRGNFEGVGMEVGIRDDLLTVIAPLKGTPAYNAGIKAGDRILKIGEKISEGLSAEEAVALIRGPKGTTVKLTLFRKGVDKSFEVSVVRDVINMPTVDTEIKGDVFVIHLYSFSSISPNMFRDSLREFIESGKHKLVLDLRGNPGGYLEAAIDMASWFLPTGKVVVKEDFRNESEAQVYRSKGYNIFSDALKMVILIDGGSASASEILAGALREHGVATLVGKQTYGKGSVQELVDITPDTSLKVTIARWLTPNGISISVGGLTPDVEVELDEEKFVDGTDTQLIRALEILNQ